MDSPYLPSIHPCSLSLSPSQVQKFIVLKEDFSIIGGELGER